MRIMGVSHKTEASYGPFLLACHLILTLILIALPIQILRRSRCGKITGLLVNIICGSSSSSKSTKVDYPNRPTVFFLEHSILRNFKSQY